MTLVARDYGVLEKLHADRARVAVRRARDERRIDKAHSAASFF